MMRDQPKWRAVVFSAALALALARLAVAEAGLPALACGDSITASTKLTEDLNCPGSDGLHVDADGITLDLGGHTLSGIAGAGHTAVLVDGHTNVTIKNGTITSFFVGVHFANAPGGSVTKVVARFDTTAIAIDGSGVAVTKNVVVSGGYAVSISGDGNTVAKNSVAAMANQALFVNGNNNVLSGNTVRASFVGISTVGQSNRITKNVVEGNAAEGIGCFGTTIVDGNTAIGNQSDGIHVDGGPASVVAKNKTRANGANGVYVSASSDGSAITANTATGNRANGIDAESVGAGTRIGKNVATLNGFDGIHAQAGVTDLGGNKARDNGIVNCATGVIACP